MSKEKKKTVSCSFCKHEHRDTGKPINCERCGARGHRLRQDINRGWFWSHPTACPKCRLTNSDEICIECGY